MHNDTDLARVKAALAREVADLAHTWEHYTGASMTDHCPRELLADGARGLEGQVLHLLTAMPNLVRTDLVLTYWGVDSVDLLVAMMEAECSWSEVADTIEDMTDHRVAWEDGDVFHYPEHDEADGNAMQNDDWEVEREGSHVRITLASSPQVLIIRDRGGDRVEAWTNGEPTQTEWAHSGNVIAEVLNYYGGLDY